jgi:Sap, sulfolipid-1-addressing protein
LLSEAIGSTLPLALAVGLSPFAVIAIVLILASTFADWLRVLAGAGLIAAGARKWSGRARDGEEATVPGWMASIDGASAGRALALGLVLSGANVKNFVLTASAAAAIVEAGAHDAQLAVAVVVFVLLGSGVVLGAVLLHLTGGPRAASLLDAVRRFMVANNAVITVLVLLLLGATVLGDGLAGLGR